MSKKLRRKNSSVVKRISIRLMKFIVFIGIPIGIFIYTFQLKNITVTGSMHYSDVEIIQRLLNTKVDNNTLIFYLNNKYFEEIKIPFVEKMSFEWVDINSISIKVYDKKITGCIEFMGDYLYFDKDGIIVESTSKRIEGIPLVNGLKYQKIVLSEKLEVQKEELFDVILNLTQQIEKYELDVDIISFNNEYEVSLDLGDIKALIGRRSTYDEILSKLKNIIIEAKGKKLTIDMRGDQDYFIAKPEISTD